MVIGKKNVFHSAANFLRSQKCMFCGSFKVCKTRRGYFRCRNIKCGKQKSLKRLRKEIGIVLGFLLTKTRPPLRYWSWHRLPIGYTRLPARARSDLSCGRPWSRQTQRRDRNRWCLLWRKKKGQTRQRRKRQKHIAGIEGFWSFAKHILYNYPGVIKFHFPRHLKEAEFSQNQFFPIRDEHKSTTICFPYSLFP